MISDFIQKMIEQKPLEKTPKKSKMVLGDVAEDVVIKKEKKNKKKKKENKECSRLNLKQKF